MSTVWLPEKLSKIYRDSPSQNNPEGVTELSRGRQPTVLPPFKSTNPEEVTYPDAVLRLQRAKTKPPKELALLLVTAQTRNLKQSTH